jgi:5,10-methylenetetrahydromethanopterin reductase
VTRPEFGIGLRGDIHRADHVARLVDESGFDVLTVFADLGFGSPLAPLLLAASTTERVRLGPACLNPYTTHPVEIASQMATLDLMSGGRAYVGLAKGAWLETISLAQPRPVRALREAAAIIDLLLRGEDTGYQGELFSVAPGFRLHNAPRRKVPLLIGAWGPQTVALAGEIADELKVGGSANPGLVPVMRGRLGAASKTRIVMGAVTVIDHDGRAARERARVAAAMYYDVVGRLDPTLDVRPGEPISDELLDRFAFAGTPKEVARHVRELFDAGASRVEFGAPFGLDVAAGLELLAREVLPEFR